MALLYSDETMPFPTVEELRKLGHDVLAALEAGQANQEIEDGLVLDFAHARGRSVLTQNRKHFRKLHQAGRTHSGIIICTVDPDFIRLATRIDAAIRAEINAEGSLADRLVSVVKPSK